MKFLVLGVDGMQGFPCAMRLARNGHQVIGVDNLARRGWVAEVGGWSATPIKSMEERLEAFDGDIDFRLLDLASSDIDKELFEGVDACVHLAEQPSAPYSMKSLWHARYTMGNNIYGNLNLLWAMREVNPDLHLIRMGTMGIYSTPNLDIPEGFFDIEYKGRKDFLPFPKQGGSYYHYSKIHTHQQCFYAAKTWGLKISSLEQGVIYGVNTKETRESPDLCTRYDFDSAFGTLINRFCAQAIAGKPLSVYGSGEQKRGFASLENTLSCIERALDHPPEKGTFEVYNQFDRVYSIMDLADAVKEASEELGIDCEVKRVPNPRVEAERHYYNPVNDKLRSIGFKPRDTLKDGILDILATLQPLKARILSKEAAIDPRVKWV